MSERRITPEDLEAIAVGAGILGTGGGGNVYVAKLWIRHLLDAGQVIRVVEVDALGDDALVVGCGGIGAPTVSFEKLRRGDEELRALRALEAHLGRRADAVIPVEVGGANSMRPMAVAALAGIPVVDADGMGRAFPELQMTTFHIYGASATPAAIADDKGNVTLFVEPVEPLELERVARARCIEMGGTAGMAEPALNGRDLARFAIPGTLSLAERIGRAVLEARARKDDPHAAILAVAGGRVLLRGKIVDVERRTARGFARGHATVAGTGADEGRAVRIDFQNENLVAWIGERALATVPDLICVVASDDGEPVGTELLRYGMRVAVLVLPAPTQLRTPAALGVVGPRAFGYDVEYVPLSSSAPRP